MWEIDSNFVAFLENLNFKSKTEEARVSGLNDSRKWVNKGWKDLVLLHWNKVPIFYYIDQDYLTLFFCMQSDFVIYVNSGVTCGVI